MINHQSTDSEPRLYRTHHWLFERFIRSAGGLKLLLQLILSKAQLDLICLTLKWWSELEKELTGEDNVNILAMTNDDINRENARREGKREGMLEGIWEGKQEGKQEVANAMLQDGIEKDFIKKYFDFSDDEVEKLLNGSANGA